jgi:hypothetical protein
MVNDVFWLDKNYSRIASYCQKDVVALAQIVLRLSGIPLHANEQISFKESLLVRQDEERVVLESPNIPSFT